MGIVKYYFGCKSCGNASGIKQATLIHRDAEYKLYQDGLSNDEFYEFNKDNENIEVPRKYISESEMYEILGNLHEETNYHCKFCGNTNCFKYWDIEINGVLLKDVVEDKEDLSAEEFTNRGIEFFNGEKYKLALDNYNSAIKINPQYSRAYFHRGYLYDKFEESETALADYNIAIEIDPTYAQAYLFRGFIFLFRGEDELCISDWKKAADLGNIHAKKYLKEHHNIDY
jgi:tetratricopeptide (TPR) repeat protein